MADQLSRLEQSLSQERAILSSSEAQYREALNTRNEMRSNFTDAQDRSAEISEMLARFSLLDRQYSTDLLRLENIRESGALFYALPSENCPVCGAKPDDHDPAGNCDASTEAVVAAAEGEQTKIRSLQDELYDVVKSLEREKAIVDQQLPELRLALKVATSAVSNITPQISAQRARFTDFLDKKSEVERGMELFEHLDHLRQRRDQIEQERRTEANDDDTSTPLPTKPLHDLSTCVASFLDDWGLATGASVHFDKDTKDFVIDGKHRSSNGKGYRALTHAAATLGLRKVTENKNLPHPGFVILDSPLLAYEKPENADDDLSGTDVNLRFLRSLAAWRSTQLIVLENRKSIPPEFIDGEGITQFTKTDAQGRYGFFPR
ncbi:hypothetical protein [Maricaulis sp.]|uniref:hypothetical protein n=1 Tax=Maricaulis sp. TaxID=1486257 RepID=UPI0025BEA5A2|nr:hypothetical protein [Maricaulis sp.]